MNNKDQKSPRNVNSRRQAQTGKRLPQESPSRGGKRQKRNRMQSPGLLTLVLLFVLITTLLVNMICAVSLAGIHVTNGASFRKINGPVTPEQAKALKREEELEEQQDEWERKGKISLPAPSLLYGDTRDDLIVASEEDLLEVLDRAYPDQKFSFQESYRTGDVQHFAGGSQYELEQVHEGMPVIGYGLSVRTDARGNILYVKGTHLDLKDFSANAVIDREKAEKLALSYVTETCGYAQDDIRAESGELSIGCPNGSRYAALAGYAVSVYTKTGDLLVRELFVDAETGEIHDFGMDVKTDRVEVTLQGQASNQTFWADEDDTGTFHMRDSDTKVEVYNAGSRSVENAHADYVANTLPMFTWNNANAAQVNASAVDAMANVQCSYRFYKDIFGLEGMWDDVNHGNMPVFVDVTSCNDGGGIMPLDFNAAMFGNSYMVVGVSGNNSPVTKSRWLDVMGHEYTHGVVRSVTAGQNVSATKEFRAINEGLAAIFGELIEDYSDNRQMDQVQWVHGSNRSAINTASRPAMLTDAKQFTDQTDEHNGIYIVAHPAYLMNAGLANDMQISSEQLTFLYYDAMMSLNASNEFTDLRKSLETLIYFPGVHGSRYVLNEKQKEAVIDAFDQVNIDAQYDRRLTPDALLTILDVYRVPYKDATVTIKTKDGKVAVSAQAVSADGTFKIPGIAPGIYDFIIEDTKSDGRTTFDAIVNDNNQAQLVSAYPESDIVNTKFGGEAGTIAVVLDSSGSMDGTPMEQLRIAADNFVDRMHELAPRTRLSLIHFDSSAQILVENTTNADELHAGIGGLYASGQTNMHEALEMAGTLLSGEENPAIVIMSDGLPCAGPDDSGDYAAPVREIAGKLKSDGVTIYSFGFFHSLSGEELVAGQELMNAIGSSGYAYQVMDAESGDIDGVFQTIAQQISEKGNTTRADVRCPVDVTVRYKGEELSSKEGGNTWTDFGILTFEGENNEHKILNLKTGPDYEIILEGYDHGTMDYSISNTDADGRYTSTRSFSQIPIRPGTYITASGGPDEQALLRADTNGDGIVDHIYAAAEKPLAAAGTAEKPSATAETAEKPAAAAGTAERPSKEGTKPVNLFIFLVMGEILLLIALAVLWFVFRQKGVINTKDTGYCTNCQAPLVPGASICRRCGTPVARTGNRKAGRNLKIAAICALVLEMLIVMMIYCSPTTDVCMRIADHEYASAAHIYETRVKNSALKRSYLSGLLEGYVKKADRAHREGRLNAQTTRDILETTALLNVGSASELAGRLLERS